MAARSFSTTASSPMAGCLGSPSMYVLVTTAGVTLEEPDDLGRFHVALDPDVADLDAALRLAGWGQAQGGGDASISVDALRRAAAGAQVEPGWDTHFDAMVD